MTLSPNRAFWMDDAGAYQADSPLLGDLRVDVAVVGAGFTGLSTAWHLRLLEPTARVAVLESEHVAFGASGRNSGWVMPHLGIGGDLMRQVHGEARAAEAHEYAVRAVDYVEEIVSRHRLDSDFRRNGSVRVAIGPTWVPALEREMASLRRTGFGQTHHWLDKETLRREFHSPWFEAGIAEETTAFLHPVKHARELKRLATEAGVVVHEKTPVIGSELIPGGVRLTTPSGVVTATKVVLATNAYTHLFPGMPEAKLKRRQFPVFAYGTMTEPLTDEQWAEVGWAGRGGLQTTINGFHTAHPTPDGRLLLAHDGYFGTRPGDAMDGDYDLRAFAAVEQQWKVLLPGLRGVRISHRWGGPVSFTPELVPHLGSLVDDRVFGFYGDIGHGVSITHLNGLVLAEMVLDHPSTYADLWFVGRDTRKWPSRSLGRIGLQNAGRVFRRLDRRNTQNLGIPLRYF